MHELRVRRKFVIEALKWLKTNNFLYNDVIIDEQVAIDHLPEDGILEQLIVHIDDESNIKDDTESKQEERIEDDDTRDKRECA